MIPPGSFYDGIRQIFLTTAARTAAGAAGELASVGFAAAAMAEARPLRAAADSAIQTRAALGPDGTWATEHRRRVRRAARRDDGESNADRAARRDHLVRSHCLAHDLRKLAARWHTRADCARYNLPSRKMGRGHSPCHAAEYRVGQDALDPTATVRAAARSRRRTMPRWPRDIPRTAKIEASASIHAGSTPARQRRTSL